MNLQWNQELLDLTKLNEVTRGDSGRIKRYLNQFQELIPTRIGLMQEYLDTDNRNMIRQTVHQMSPQLHFFGLPGVSDSIERIEKEYVSMPMDELKELSFQLIHQLELAKAEIDRIVQENY